MENTNHTKIRKIYLKWSLLIIMSILFKPVFSQLTLGNPVYGDCGLVTFYISGTHTSEFCIYFGDGSSEHFQFSSTVTNYPVQHEYNINGEFVATLCYSCDNCQKGGNDAETVTVTNAINAAFDAPPVCVGFATVFSNASIGANTYTWTFGDGSTSTSASPTHTYAAPGSYIANLLIENNFTGCFDQVTQIVEVEMLPIVDIQASPLNICAGSAVQFTSSDIIGGQYLWTLGDGTTTTQPNPEHYYSTAGIYLVHYEAVNHCQAAAYTSPEITINVYHIPLPAISAVSAACENNTAIEFTSEDNTYANYTWTYNDGSSPETVATPTTTHGFPQEGFYTVMLTLDNNGCIGTATHNINITSLPEVEIIPEALTLCPGEDVNLQAHILNYVDNESYVYQWSNGSNQGQLNVISSGTFELTVTGLCGSATSNQVDIIEYPLPEATLNVTNIASCPGKNDASAQVVINGDPADYSITWPPYSTATGSEATDLYPGNLYVTVTNLISGCKKVLFASVGNNSISINNLNIINETCSTGGDGSIAIGVIGGTAPYTYLWNDPAPAQTTQTAVSLTAGTYSVTITDANACSITKGNLFVSVPLLTLSITSGITTCGDENAIVTATAGINPPNPENSYYFNWYNSSDVSQTSNSTGNVSSASLPEGEYYIVVTDNINSCSLQGQHFQVTHGPGIDVTISSSQESSCVAASDNWIKATVQNAYPPFTYTWENDASTIIGTNYIVQNIPAGNYNLTVTDSRGCSETSSTTIAQPTIMTVKTDIINCGVQAKVTGGTSPYECHWIKVERNTAGDITSENTVAITAPSPSPINQNNLPIGEYYVLVIDANGCQKESLPFEILAPVLAQREFILSSHWVKPAYEDPEPEPDQTIIDQVDDIITALYNAVEECREAKASVVANGYCKLCQSRDFVEDKLSVVYSQKYTNYTLYYYDRSGNLVQTVPPEGVKTYTITDALKKRNEIGLADHTMKTTYEYNSLNQLVKQNTPDGKTTNFIYNEKGQLRFSQNQQQLVDGKYSYTKYDEHERIIESGQSSLDVVALFSLTTDYREDMIDYGKTFPAINNEYVVHTIYSTLGDVDYFGQKQEYLQNRVSYSYTDEDGSSATCNDQTYTFYSYDPHGNVKWLVQDLPGFTKNYIGYEYDLISNNVQKVKYNEQRPDRFFHRYEYDSDNRIKEVYTSIDGRIWDKDAKYDYYKHGPLRKTEIGEDKIQDIDYTYTINGWLKAINHPALDITSDPSQDGIGTSSLTGFAKDVYGMTLGYYNGDYRDDSPIASANTYATTNLYNGNISSWTSNSSAAITESPGVMTGQAFEYDNLSRLTKSNMFFSTGSWNQQGVNNYETQYSYDKNGNIQTLKRKSNLPIIDGIQFTNNQMDDLSYSYITGTNKLNQVIDNSTADVNSNLEDIFGTTTYEYDEIGNLVKETGQVMKDHLAWNVIRNITWTPSGKVSTVNIVETKPDLSETNTVNIKYQYDASGNRVIKYVKYLDHPLDNKKEYYLRDAQGNIMTVYERKVTPIDGTTDVEVKFRVKEVPLYGSDRIGMLEPNILDQTYDLYSVNVAAGTEDNISFEVNGIQINDGLYNWLIPRNAAINANGEAICSCQLEHWEFANGTIIKSPGTQFMGKTGNNIGVAENKNGEPVLYTVTAKNYLGTPGVSLVLDKDGNLMKGSQLIKASSEAKTMVMKSPGATNEYSLIAIDDNNQAWLHKINLSAQGFATGNSIPTGEVYAGIPISTAGEKIGRHLTIIEDEINNINYLYALRFNEPTMQGAFGTSELLMYEFKDDGQVPAPVVIASIQGFDRTGEGELQISPDGTHLLYYNKLKSIGGFNYKDVDMVALELSADHKSIVPGTIIHINTIGGSHSKASADFIKYQSMSSSNFMFNQHSTIELQGTDKQTWYFDNSNGNIPNQLANLTEKGDVRRGKDFRVYIPGHDNETSVNALSNDLTNAQEDLIDIAGNMLAGSLPGQIFRLRGMGNEEIFTREIGLKKFEIKDHLQSSIITVKDFKKPIDAESDGIFESAEAQIVSYQETYPFGMQMPGRSFNSSEYRFGFNGKEKDDEWTGSTGATYDYGFRIYDSRIARFLSVDPNAHLRVEWTPYNAMRCNPILNIDPDGALDTDFKDKEGNLITHIEDGSNAVFQLTGDSRSEEYFKFTGYDEKQGGENKVNVESAIKGSQDYVRENYTSDINDKGVCTQTYCNYGTMNIAKTYESAVVATGQKADISDIKGSARDIGGKLATSKVVTPATDLAAAQKAAKEGKFVVGYWPGHVFTLNKQGLINNVGAPRPKNNVFDPKYTEGKGQKFYIIQVPKAQDVAPK